MAGTCIVRKAAYRATQVTSGSCDVRLGSCTKQTYLNVASLASVACGSPAQPLWKPDHGSTSLLRPRGRYLGTCIHSPLGRNPAVPKQYLDGFTSNMVAYGHQDVADPLSQLSLPSMKEVARDFWQTDIVLPQLASISEASGRTAYHGYAVRQRTSLAGLPDCPSVTIRTYVHLVTILQQLRDDALKEDLLNSLNTTMALKGPDKLHENSINLAARLLTMLKVGRAENQVAARGYLDWQTGTFRDLVKKRFLCKSCSRIRARQIPQGIRHMELECSSWLVHRIH